MTLTASADTSMFLRVLRRVSSALRQEPSPRQLECYTQVHALSFPDVVSVHLLFAELTMLILPDVSLRRVENPVVSALRSVWVSSKSASRNQLRRHVCVTG